MHGADLKSQAQVLSLTSTGLAFDLVKSYEIILKASLSSHHKKLLSRLADVHFQKRNEFCLGIRSLVEYRIACSCRHAV